MRDYERIEKAILFIRENFKQQPELDEVAKHVHLSPFHFQRLFKDWAGVSPKKFLKYITVEHAKELLRENYSILDTSFEIGLSGSSRLHDLFISIEGMTPGEFKSGGEHLKINYSFIETIFGDVLIASTSKGICYLSFVNERDLSTSGLLRLFPSAKFTELKDSMQEEALRFFSGDWSNLLKVKLHLKGTPFQLKVWQSLLKIPFGKLLTYGSVANSADSPNASRAVGTAIGSNPVAFLIPCHRVIRSTGIVGDYRWGSGRKVAILGWEAARISQGQDQQVPG